MIGEGKLDLIVSGNYTIKKIKLMNNPASVKTLTGPLAGQTVFNATLMFTSEPKFKILWS
jgi:hypothetical protein